MALNYLRLCSSLNFMSNTFKRCCHISCKNRAARKLMKMLSSKEERDMWRIKTQPDKTFRKMEGKRAPVLNKLFMVNVTQAMMSSEFEVLLGNKGLQITKASVDANLRYVHVYWVANNSEDFIEIQTMLDGLSGQVRKKLMFSRMSGRIPEIKFKRDVAQEQYEITLRALHNMRLLSSENKDEPEEYAPQLQSSQDLHIEDSSVMRQDTLGLKYDAVLQRILTAKRKAYPLKFPVPSSSSNVISDDSEVKNIDEDQEMSYHEKRLAVKKFISQQRKMLMYSRNTLPNTRFHSEESTLDSDNSDDEETSFDTHSFDLDEDIEEWDDKPKV